MKTDTIWQSPKASPVQANRQSAALAVLTPAPKNVIRRIRNAEVTTFAFARTRSNPALGVDAQNGRCMGQDSIAAMVDCIELEPGNIVRFCTGHTRDHFALDTAAVGKIPIRAGVVPLD